MTGKDQNIIIYLPFKKISLDEKDNKWINKFQTIIKIGLKQIIKSEFNPILEFNDKAINFSDKKFADTGVIIQVLLKADFNSDGLLNEKSLTNELKNKNIINIYCDPEINQIAGQRISVNLFNEASGKKYDLSGSTNELIDNVWLKFLDISYKIRNILSSAGNETVSTNQNIYVAETSSDQNHNRGIINRELEHLGYKVLPEDTFPSELIAYSDMVNENIKKSVLSIHIFGNLYTPVNKNLEISGIELQNDIFIEVAEELNSQDKNIHRLVWIPPDINPKSEKQRLYIESFKRNIELLRNTEIIQSPVEVFKNIIKNKVTVITSKKTEKVTLDKSQTNSVYVVSNSTETKYLEDIRKELTKHNISVLETVEHNNKIDLIHEHYNNLTNCDGILILYTNMNRQWFNSKLSDILKAPGFGRKKKFKSISTIFLSENIPEFNIKINEMDLIKAKGENIEKILNPIIEKFK
ncbi:MAG: hypothetical protein KOO66_06000 [Bacteroidales bacterium]|nr:hypothetical protein [Bacteroidales bacterium]